jgi:4-amino-4-deoxy-L-arabinose transferase-like glycosyltransferase
MVRQVATAAGVGLLLFGLVSTLAREPTDLLPILVITPVGVWGIWLLARQVAEPEDRAIVWQFALAGAVLRLGLALAIHANIPEDFFAPDQVTYGDVGWRTLLYHRGTGSLPWQLENTTEVGHFYWNAFLFMIFGHATIAPKIVNAFVGAASGILAYRLGGDLAGRDTARYSLALTMFFPSLVLWSALNLRDPIVLLATVGTFLAMAHLRTRPSGRSFFAVLLGIGAMILFRDYIAVMVVFGIVGSTVITRARGLPANVFVGLLLFGLAVLTYQQFGLGSRWVESASFEQIAIQRVNLATGGSAFRPEANVSTPLQGLQFLPVGLAFFLFSPFPWQIGTALSAMTLPEQVIWYALLPAVLMGGRYLLKHRYEVFGPTFVFLIITTGVYALVEGNAGTAYRHRAQVLVFFLVMAAVGLALRKARRAEAAPR